MGAFLGTPQRLLRKPLIAPCLVIPAKAGIQS